MRLLPALAIRWSSVAYSGWLLAAALGAAGCTGPDNFEQQLAKTLEEQLDALARSASGPWTGTSVTVVLKFQLQQAADNTVAGSGTSAEGSVTNPESYTVSGSYQRPRLALTFRGMTYQGRTVDGTFQGDYGSVAGISGTLHLTATGYTKDIDILLQEPL